MPTFALNFSRPGAQVVAQYYTLLRLGFEGYRRVQQSCRDNARWLASQIAELGPFQLISDGGDLPVFAFRLRDEIERYTVFDVSETLRIKGWLVPAYHMPPALQDVAVLRVVSATTSAATSPACCSTTCAGRCSDSSAEQPPPATTSAAAPFTTEREHRCAGPLRGPLATPEPGRAAAVAAPASRRPRYRPATRSRSSSSTSRPRAARLVPTRAWGPRGTRSKQPARDARIAAEPVARADRLERGPGSSRHASSAPRSETGAAGRCGGCRRRRCRPRRGSPRLRPATVRSRSSTRSRRTDDERRVVEVAARADGGARLGWLRRRGR